MRQPGSLQSSGGPIVGPLEPALPDGYRRATATYLVRAGVNVEAVRLLVGHRQLSTTACYVEVEREDLRRAVEILDRRP